MQVPSTKNTTDDSGGFDYTMKPGHFKRQKTIPGIRLVRTGTAPIVTFEILGVLGVFEVSL